MFKMQINEYVKQPHVLELLEMIGNHSDPVTLTELSNNYTKSPTTAHTILQRLVREGIIKRITNTNNRPRYVTTEATTAYLEHRQHHVTNSTDIDDFVREPEVLHIIKLVMDEPKRLYEIEKHSTKSHSRVHNILQKLTEYGYVRRVDTDHLNRPEYIATNQAVLLIKNLADTPITIVKQQPFQPANKPIIIDELERKLPTEIVSQQFKKLQSTHMDYLKDLVRCDLEALTHDLGDMDLDEQSRSDRWVTRTMAVDVYRRLGGELK